MYIHKKGYSVIASIVLCFKGIDSFDFVLANYGNMANLSLPILFYFFILFVGSMTSITSSSISLEGKTINITKSMPVSERMILKSKILASFVIELPFIIFADIIFFIKFRPSIFYVVVILLLSFLIIFLTSCIGLIVNLKYPKMNWTSDAEVVKQSISSMISVFIGMGILIGSIFTIFSLSRYADIDLLLVLHVFVIAIISMILYVILMNNGTEEYKKINV